MCGDVSELSGELEWALGLLRERFRQVIWVPGNHELWSTPEDPVQLRGEERYRYLVDVCRRLGVLHAGGPLPGVEGAPAARSRSRRSSCSTTTRSAATSLPTKELALARAHAAGVVCSDELVLHPDPLCQPGGVVRAAGVRERAASQRAAIPSCPPCWSTTSP